MNRLLQVVLGWLLIVLVILCNNIFSQVLIPSSNHLEHFTNYYSFYNKSFFNGLNDGPVNILPGDKLPSYDGFFVLDSINTHTNSIVSLPHGNKLAWLNTASNISGKIRTNLFYSVGLIVSNSSNQQFEIGTNKTKYGLTGRINNAWVLYRKKKVELLIGRIAYKWGPGVFSSLYLNGELPQYDQIGVKFRFSPEFQVHSFTSKLPTIYDGNNSMINRFLSGHRVKWNINDKMVFGFGDIILYSGLNRDLNFAYSNPFIPYFASIYEGGNESATNDDNMLIFFELLWQYTSYTRFYSEFIIDDFQVDIKDRAKIDDALGITLGHTLNIPINKKVDLNTQIEYTVLNTWVYNHSGLLSSYTYKDRPIGNQEGGDVEELHIRTDLWKNRKLSFGLQYDYVAKGEITPTEPWRAYETKHADFPLGTVQYANRYTLDFYWYTKKYRYVKPYITYEAIQNLNHELHNDDTSWDYGVEMYWWI